MAAPDRIVLATANLGKVREITEILAGLEVSVEIVAQSEFGVDSPEEDGKTFVENALIKARHAANETGCPRSRTTRASSSTHSTAGPAYTRRVTRGLMPPMTATSTSCWSSCRACPLTCARRISIVVRVTSRPTIRRRSSPKAAGKARLRERSAAVMTAFGYDPVFYDPEAGRTAAELGPEQKNARSHRGKA